MIEPRNDCLRFAAGLPSCSVSLSYGHPCAVCAGSDSAASGERAPARGAEPLPVREVLGRELLDAHAAFAAAHAPYLAGRRLPAERMVEIGRQCVERYMAGRLA